ncbi:unnamed protein product [Caenorhabditis bovis]|uniref:Ubiquitin carboxyl-terminal hydrolase 36 n=1 Tax=Caenorhabditis bovis TaxID=2654633 RepID=A0A8S1EHE8_9PELO|nr:unnamed protein product [Caenorhabditis bovis]
MLLPEPECLNDEEVAEIARIPTVPPTGIANFSTNCYSIAVLQALLSSDAFMEETLRNDSKDVVVKRARKFLANYCNNQSSVNMSFMAISGLLGFTMGSQEDAVEFHMKFVEKMCPNIPGFPIKFRTDCYTCNTVDTIEQTLPVISLYPSQCDESSVTLEDLLNSTFKTFHKIDGTCACGDSKYRCESAIELKPLIVFSFIQFQYHQQTAKGSGKKRSGYTPIWKRITIPREFDAELLFTEPPKGMKATYRFVSAVLHRGTTSESGHYLALATRKTDSYFVCDDNNVDEVSTFESRFTRRYVPYMAYYELVTETPKE